MPQSGTQTTGGVNWIDPLQYQKPRFVPITVPEESTAVKYYVDLSGGTDSGTCGTFGSPCKTIRRLANRDLTGLRGNAADTAAYVYAKGIGPLFLYNDNFAGTAGKEVVIKPWDNFVVNVPRSTGSNGFSGSGVHDIILDGGPNLNIHFVSDLTGDNYAFNVTADNITVYRTQAYANTTALLFVAGSYVVCNNVKFINNEMHTCDFGNGFQCSGVYVGPGTGGGYSNFLFKNNIVRNMGGEGIEINPRVTSNNITIEGNAIHNIGKVTCAGGWQCRPGITVNIQNLDNENNGTIIANNLIWDTAASGIWNRGGGNPKPVIYNNTIYD